MKSSIAQGLSTGLAQKVNIRYVKRTNLETLSLSALPDYLSDNSGYISFFFLKVGRLIHVSKIIRSWLTQKVIAAME